MKVLNAPLCCKKINNIYITIYYIHSRIEEHNVFVHSLLVLVQLWFGVANLGAQITDEARSMGLFHVVSKDNPAKKLSLASGAPVIFVIEPVNLQVIFALEAFEAEVAYLLLARVSVEVLKVVIHDFL